MENRFSTWHMLLLLAVILVCTSTVQAQWVNGQDAMMVIGQPDFTSGAAGTTATTLNSPKAVAVDANHGKLYVVDGDNNRILRFAYPVVGLQPAAELVFGQLLFTTNNNGTSQKTFDGPRGIAVDQTGRLWVSDLVNNRVLWFNSAHAISVNQPNADGVLGQPDFNTNGCGLAQNSLCQPYGLAVSEGNTLYVADAGNNRVLRFDNASGKTNGADADGVLGQPDFITNNPVTSRNGMNVPRGVAVQETALFVADRDNRRVLRFDDASGKPNGTDADGVLGQPDFITNAPSLTQNGMVFPGRLAVDQGGRLYVSEGLGGNRILIFSNAAGKVDGAPADFVIGQPDFITNAVGTNQNRMDLDTSGSGMAIDYANDLLMVSDDNNNRLMIFQARFPAITLDPVSLSFSTVQGVNPGNKTIELTNGGEDILNWTAGVEAGLPSWLTVTPPNGSGNALLTIAVDSIGMAPGTYNKTITVSDPGATNTPQAVGVSLTIVPNKLYLPLLLK